MAQCYGRSGSPAHRSAFASFRGSLLALRTLSPRKCGALLQGTRMAVYHVPAVPFGPLSTATELRSLVRPKQTLNQMETHRALKLPVPAGRRKVSSLLAAVGGLADNLEVLEVQVSPLAAFHRD